MDLAGDLPGDFAASTCDHLFLDIAIDLSDTPCGQQCDLPGWVVVVKLVLAMGAIDHQGNLCCETCISSVLSKLALIGVTTFLNDVWTWSRWSFLVPIICQWHARRLWMWKTSCVGAKVFFFRLGQVGVMWCCG